MTKKEFLEILAQKLKILNKDEVADIVNEYAGYIDNKIAEGKTEEEAVADFGNVNDLAKEILSAYKLSEDYIPPDEFSGSRFFSDTADILNKSIEFMTRFFKDIYTHTSANRVINILVAVFAALVLIAIIKIPFFAIEHLGTAFFHFVLPPFLYGPLSFIWIFILNVVFLIVVIFVFVSLLNGGFGKNIEYIKNSIINVAQINKEYREKYEKNRRKHRNKHYCSDSPETPASGTPVSEAPGNDDHASRRVNETDAMQKSAANNPLTVLLRIIISLFAAILLLPLFVSVIGLGVAVGVLVYLLTQGILIYGLTLLVIGFFILFTSFISLMINIIYKYGKKLKSPVASIVIASVLIGFGGVFSFFEFMDYDYIDTIPEAGEFVVRKNYIYDITADEIIINANGAVLKYVNDNTPGNRIKLDVRYNDLYNDVDIHSTVKNQSDNNFFYNNSDKNAGGVQIITIDHSSKKIHRGFYSGKETIKNIIDGLKDKKIYNMRNLFIPEITVYANETFFRNVSGSYGNSSGMHSLILERRRGNVDQ